MTRPGWSVGYDADADRGRIEQVKETSDPGVAVQFNIQFQHGPIGDNGVNGVQNEEIIELLIQRIKALDERFPCVENFQALRGLETAAEALALRTRRREEQGVEGQNAAHVS